MALIDLLKRLSEEDVEKKPSVVARKADFGDFLKTPITLTGTQAFEPSLRTPTTRTELVPPPSALQRLFNAAQDIPRFAAITGPAALASGLVKGATFGAVSPSIEGLQPGIPERLTEASGTLVGGMVGAGKLGALNRLLGIGGKFAGPILGAEIGAISALKEPEKIPERAATGAAFVYGIERAPGVLNPVLKPIAGALSKTLQKIGEATIPEFIRRQISVLPEEIAGKMRAAVGAVRQGSITAKEFEDLSITELSTVEQKRLFQLIRSPIGEAGKVTSIPKLAEKAVKIQNQFEQLRKDGVALNLISDKTFTQRLPRAELRKLEGELSKTEKQIASVNLEPFRRRIAEAVDKIDIKGKEKLSDKLFSIANKLEKKFPDLQNDIKGIALGLKSIKTKTDARLIASVARKAGKVGAGLEKEIVDAFAQSIRLTTPKTKGVIDLTKTVPRYFGRAGSLNELEEKAQSIKDQIRTSFVRGGTGFDPRLYLEKLPDNPSRFWNLGQKTRMRLGWTRERMQNLPIATRKALGEVDTPGAPVAEKIAQETHDIAFGRLFSQLSSDVKLASKLEVPGWTKMPDTKSFGSLKDMWVRPDVASAVNDVYLVPANAVTDAINSSVGLFKTLKVTANPPTWMMNIFGNTMFSYLNGVSPFNTGLLEQAAKSYMKRGPDYLKHAKAGLFGTDYYSSEVVRGLLKMKGDNIFTKALNAVKDKAQNLGEFYAAQDHVYRHMIVLNYEKQGLSTEQAMQKMLRLFPDYSNVAAFVREIRRNPSLNLVVNPFISFPAESLRIFKNALEDNPGAVLTTITTPYIVTELAKRSLGMKDEEYEKLTGLLPDYMKKGIKMLVPMKDKDGNPFIFDATYAVPWGQWTEISQDIGELPKQFLSGPGLSMVNALSSDEPIDKFTGRAIFNKEDTLSEKTQKLSNYMLSIWSPGIVSSFAAGQPLAETQPLSGKRLVEAVEGIPTGKMRKTRQAELEAFRMISPIKPIPVDVKELQIKRVSEINFAQRQMDAEIKKIQERLPENPTPEQSSMANDKIRKTSEKFQKRIGELSKPFRKKQVAKSESSLQRLLKGMK